MVSLSLADKIGLLRRRRAALHSRLVSAPDGSFDSSGAHAAPTSEQLAERLAELAELEQVESELAEMESQFEQLRWQTP